MTSESERLLQHCPLYDASRRAAWPDEVSVEDNNTTRQSWSIGRRSRRSRVSIWRVNEEEKDLLHLIKNWAWSWSSPKTLSYLVYFSSTELRPHKNRLVIQAAWHWIAEEASPDWSSEFFFNRPLIRPPSTNFPFRCGIWLHQQNACCFHPTSPIAYVTMPVTLLLGRE